MTGTKMSRRRSARRRLIWLTTPPEWDPAGLTDFSRARDPGPATKRSSPTSRARSRASPNDDVRVRSAEAVAPLLGGSGNWQGVPTSSAGRADQRAGPAAGDDLGHTGPVGVAGFAAAAGRRQL